MLLGFGCMRLPMNGDKVNLDEFQQMVDLYMKEGFNYFDTARVYIGGQSETALKECLSSKYPRESFVLTDKLSGSCFKTKEDIRPLFMSQLESCGVKYFDYYLHHCMTKKNYAKHCDCDAFEEVKKLKAEGYIKHIGFSFHDDLETLKKILDERPEIEIVQIQFNYYDYNNPSVQSRELYEELRKRNIPVLIMEPVRGGSLARIPEPAKKMFDDLHTTNSFASYAIRYAASFEGVKMVLSGMSNIPQMKDNLSYMKDFKPLNEKEKTFIDNVTKVYLDLKGINCTGCKYCVDGCPKQIPIPNAFSCYNSVLQFNDPDAKENYEWYTNGKGKASDCIKCGKCEASCPQHLEIRKYLEDVAKKFE